jgi:AraC family transcriptional regulator of adaptative response/methylated-DNA-[protein]-cysteine methyltransferase
VVGPGEGAYIVPVRTLPPTAAPPPAMPPPARMYGALLRRDPAFDGLFVVGVRTTGIFCRPVCPARKPRRENVEFFADPAAAAREGYRPCRRCRPTAPAEAPPWLARVTARVERATGRRVADAELLEDGVDPRRARRWFLAHHGTTFQGWQRARRLGVAADAIDRGEGCLRAGLAGGWESASGFGSAFKKTFGRAPGAARGESRLVSRRLETPLGAMLAVAADDGLCLLEFGDRRALERELAATSRARGAAIVPGDHPVLDAIERELREWFAGTRDRFSVPLAPRGTPFQRAVWDRLARIPYGSTASYAQVAADVGRPAAVRAVGRANGTNQLAVVIPCHRVVRADGTLCGYGGGVWRKRRLLDHERSVRLRTGR